jgi:hypothetical protein
MLLARKMQLRHMTEQRTLRRTLNSSVIRSVSLLFTTPRKGCGESRVSEMRY